MVPIKERSHSGKKEKKERMFFSISGVQFQVWQNAIRGNGIIAFARDALQTGSCSARRHSVQRRVYMPYPSFLSPESVGDPFPDILVRPCHTGRAGGSHSIAGDTRRMRCGFRRQVSLTRCHSLSTPWGSQCVCHSSNLAVASVVVCMYCHRAVNMQLNSEAHIICVTFEVLFLLGCFQDFVSIKLRRTDCLNMHTMHTGSSNSSGIQGVAEDDIRNIYGSRVIVSEFQSWC